MQIKERLKEFWHWVWNSESIWSYLVFLILVFIIVKFMFFPLLGIAFSSELPMAIVESSSMDHNFIKYCVSTDVSRNKCNAFSGDYELCGEKISESIPVKFDDYWLTCGGWYSRNTDINKEQFQDFSFKNGFRKGDILIIMGWKKPEVGDVVLFKPNPESLAPRPIIHRAISTEPLQTKGDHNEKQLSTSNNAYKTDETDISGDQVIGIAVARIPWLGWGKLIFVEIWKNFG
jgi:signal peptidase I